MSTECSPAIRIERAREEHVPEIAALAKLFWRACYPGIIAHEQIEYMLTRMYALDVLRQEIASGIVFERAHADGALRGFSSFGGSGEREVKLHKLYVHPEWQRRGIGTALLKSCERAAREGSAQTLILNVNKRNEPAINAYSRYGFTIRDSVTTDIGDGFVMDDYVMAKAL